MREPHRRVEIRLIGVQGRRLRDHLPPIHNEKKAPHCQPQHLTEKREISAYRLHIKDSWGKVTLLILSFAPLKRIFIYNIVESTTFENTSHCARPDDISSLLTAHILFSPLTTVQTPPSKRNKAPSLFRVSRLVVKWRRPTLPRVCSTIGAVGLNFSVRNGKRWNPVAITTGNIS